MLNCINRFVLMEELKANYLAPHSFTTVISLTRCGEVSDIQILRR